MSGRSKAPRNLKSCYDAITSLPDWQTRIVSSAELFDLLYPDPHDQAKFKTDQGRGGAVSSILMALGATRQPSKLRKARWSLATIRRPYSDTVPFPRKMEPPRPCETASSSS